MKRCELPLLKYNSWHTLLWSSNCSTGYFFLLFVERFETRVVKKVQNPSMPTHRALQMPNFCPECQRVFRDPVECPEEESKSICRRSKAKLNPHVAYPLDSPLIASMPYEPLEFFLMSRHPKPIKENFGGITAVLPPNVTAIYLLTVMAFFVHKLSYNESVLDHFKGLICNLSITYM